MKRLRIISLLPAATEMIYDLGLAKNLVGVSFDSDYPTSVRKLPQVVTTLLPQGLSSKEIDKRVRKAKHTGIGIFHTDQELLKHLKPNLIISQELCEVCAIGTSEIKKAARILKNEIQTISLEPESVGDIFENINLVGEVTNKKKAAQNLVTNLSQRISTVVKKVRNKQKPRALIIEWLEPLMVAGHWVPEMVELAGGLNLLTTKGAVSKTITWERVVKANPDILIIAPCGFDIVRTKKELGIILRRKGFENLKAARSNNIYLVDGNAYLTRPGPRIIDGVEIFAEIFHPESFVRRYSKKDWQKV